MPVSTSEQNAIQTRLESASQEDLDELRRNAETMLRFGQGNAIMPRRRLSSIERHEVEKAIEVLVRLECLEVNGGWWFRQKRRYALLKEYVGS